MEWFGRIRTRLFFNGGWLLRVVTTTALVGIIALSLFPRAVSHISTSATVNAPLMIIRSPIEGLVEDYALTTGAPVSRGQELVVFREADTDLTYEADLESRLRISTAAGQAVASRIARVEALKADLVRRQSTFVAWHRAVLETELLDLDAQIRGAQAQLRVFVQDFDRKARLKEQGTLAASALADARALKQTQTELVRALQARRDGRRLMLRALDDGVLAGTAGTNTPYTRQRQDEVELELARLRDELSDHRAEQTALRDQLARERALNTKETQITLTSPVAGVVWRSAALTGRPVLPGDEVVELLDCSARFLEAYLPESLMGRIALGDMADVRLTGETRSFRAPVISILGHGAQFDHADFAARDDAPKTGKMRVLIELSPDNVGYDASRFCHVGRTAEVSLPRDLSGLSYLTARLGAAIDQVALWFGGAAEPVRRG